MTKTSERRTPGVSGRPGDQAQDLFHLFPYHFVATGAAPESRLLEVGFGEGYGVPILAPVVGEYVGLEVSESAVGDAVARRSPPNVRFMLYDGLTFPLADESFETVISFHVLEHLSAPDRFLDEVGRVCRPGGRIVLVTPNAAIRLAPGERPWNRFHVQEFTADQLTRLLSARFDNVEVMGVAGSKAMNDLERERVERARQIARFDPLGLRYRIPEGWALPLRGLLMRLTEGRKDDAPPATFDLGDVHLLRDDLEDAIHLMAVIEC